jgi:hypothetical protein
MRMLLVASMAHTSLRVPWVGKLSFIATAALKARHLENSRSLKAPSSEILSSPTPPKNTPKIFTPNAIKNSKGWRSE